MSASCRARPASVAARACASSTASSRRAAAASTAAAFGISSDANLRSRGIPAVAVGIYRTLQHQFQRFEIPGVGRRSLNRLRTGACSLVVEARPVRCGAGRRLPRPASHLSRDRVSGGATACERRPATRRRAPPTSCRRARMAFGPRLIPIHCREGRGGTPRAPRPSRARRARRRGGRHVRWSFRPPGRSRQRATCSWQPKAGVHPRS